MTFRCGRLLDSLGCRSVVGTGRVGEVSGLWSVTVFRIQVISRSLENKMNSSSNESAVTFGGGGGPAGPAEAQDTPIASSSDSSVRPINDDHRAGSAAATASNRSGFHRPATSRGSTPPRSATSGPAAGLRMGNQTQPSAGTGNRLRSRSPTAGTPRSANSRASSARRYLPAAESQRNDDFGLGMDQLFGAARAEMLQQQEDILDGARQD